MKATSLYRPVFKLSIYHNYFLNDGEVQFSNMTDNEKESQLKNYNWQDFMNITPTARTKDMLNGQLMIFKSFPNQLLVVVKVSPDDDRTPYVSLAGDQQLIFKLSITDPFFDNYTNLERAGALFYFSNKELMLPESHNFNTIHTSNQQATVTSRYLFDGENKGHLLEFLDKDESINTDGILHVYMQGDHTNKSPIINDGRIKNNLPHFKIHFDNQKTTWKYIHLRDGFETETKQEWPLTRFGYIPMDKPSDFKSPPADLDKYNFPNPSPQQIKFIANKPYSEIFI
ncbi:hypothetical protein FKX85_15790 [Echinicola soli]|uniref:Uncharacterized protein n=1 Tax=Echinicola soli TaxID=2591634 RepID=A0A514CKS3_9BACT|nr:hypothetical protein [Echinicola soli]QDH80423.1 hypothetical protein FKX85_15790 [Echinicola soli]